MRGFKIATARLAAQVKAALHRYTKLEAQRARVPRWIPVGAVVSGDVVQLAVEHRHQTRLLPRRRARRRRQGQRQAGLRTDYAPTYYAAFLLDPDGNNVEAVWMK